MNVYLLLANDISRTWTKQSRLQSTKTKGGFINLRSLQKRSHFTSVFVMTELVGVEGLAHRDR